MRRQAVVATLASAALLALSGCQSYNSTQSRSNEEARSEIPRVMDLLEARLPQLEAEGAVAFASGGNLPNVWFYPNYTADELIAERATPGRPGTLLLAATDDPIASLGFVSGSRAENGGPVPGWTAAYVCWSVDIAPEGLSKPYDSPCLDGMDRVIPGAEHVTIHPED